MKSHIDFYAPRAPLREADTAGDPGGGRSVAGDMSDSVILMDYHMRRAIDAELNHWGGWLERHRDFEGYPRCDNIQAFLNGAGGGTPGHRVLCDDMPTAVFAVHGRVLRLPEAEQEAVWVFFAYRLQPDGLTFWTLEEKCRLSGIQEASMRRRIARARYRIAGLPVPRWERKQEAVAA